MGDGEKTGPGRPATSMQMVVEAVADLYQGRPLMGSEITDELAVRMPGRAASTLRVALRNAREAGLIEAQKIGRAYIYSPLEP